MRQFQSLAGVGLFVFDPDGFAVSLARRTAAMCGVTNARVFTRADEVLEALESGRQPGALVVDWRPPAPEGLDLCRAVRRRATSPAPFLPILLLSTQGTRPCVSAARDAGVDEFLVRPFSRRDFEERLRAAVYHRRNFIDVPTYFGPDRRTGGMAEMLAAERRNAVPLYIDPDTGRSRV
jgi:two-component system chemotaxis response regulator CheY